MLFLASYHLQTNSWLSTATDFLAILVFIFHWHFYEFSLKILTNTAASVHSAVLILPSHRRYRSQYMVHKCKYVFLQTWACSVFQIKLFHALLFIFYLYKNILIAIKFFSIQHTCHQCYLFGQFVLLWPAKEVTLYYKAQLFKDIILCLDSYRIDIRKKQIKILHAATCSLYL